MSHVGHPCPTEDGALSPAPVVLDVLEGSSGDSPVDEQLENPESRIPLSADPGPDDLADTPNAELTSTNVRGGDPLGSPPRMPLRECHDGDSRSHSGDVPVVDPDDTEPATGKGRGFLKVASTDEQVAAAKEFYAEWTKNENDGQKQHAQGRSTVFSIMQFREHPDSGVTLITQEQWAELLAELERAGVLDRHAAIWHDKDELPDGRPKALHFHGVVRLTPGSEKQVRFLAIRGFIPASRIRTPKDAYAEGKVVTGRLAADISFFDFCQYLVHEDESSREQGKYLYPRDEVAANFDFGAFLDAGRPAKAKRERAKDSAVDRLVMRILEGGLTLREAFEADPLAYNKGESRMLRARTKWVEKLPQPAQRINIYLYGPGGVGKDAIARALARQLVPGDWRPGEVEPFFIAGGDNVMFEGYDGEPVVIFEEVRAVDLMVKFGRSSLFAYLNPFPGRQRFNVKNASVMPQNVITIMTGPDDYHTFLDGLAGEYTDRAGVKHLSENKGQAYRRFPLIIPVRSDEFDVLVNRGFAEGTDDYREYIAYQGFRQGMRSILGRVKGVPEAQRVATHLALEARQVAPIKQQYDVVVGAVSSDQEDPEALLAEFSDVGQVVPPEERQRAQELASSERVLTYLGAVEAVRSDYQNWMALCAAHHGLDRDDPHLRAHAEIWRSGSGCACLPGNKSHQVWPFLADHRSRAEAVDEALSAAWRALTPTERQGVPRYDARAL